MENKIKQELINELLFLANNKIEKTTKFIKELKDDFYETEELKEIYVNWVGGIN